MIIKKSKINDFLEISKLDKKVWIYQTIKLKKSQKLNNNESFEIC